MPDQITATPEATHDEPAKRYKCRHIFLNGHRCGSPSLRGQPFCYYHQRDRGFAADRRHCRQWPEFEFPSIEDRSSLLAATAEVLQRIAAGILQPKQAGLLLYGLQIASRNLPKTDESAPEDPQVEEVISAPRYGDLAPVAEIVEDATPTVTDPQAFEPQDALCPVPEEADEAVHNPSAPSILPSLNASAPITSSPIESTQTRVITPSKSQVISTEDGAFAAAAESPLPSHRPTVATNSHHTARPEINIPNPASNRAAWYPNNCHANEKRTPRPPHSAHRHQAAQRRRPGRRHELDGLQLA